MATLTRHASALSVALLATTQVTSAQDFKAACAGLAQGFQGSGRVVTVRSVSGSLSPSQPRRTHGSADRTCSIRIRHAGVPKFALGRDLEVLLLR
jgi:hypothetical protein